MKGTIVGPVYPYRGGIAHYTTQLARAFESSGHQVNVVSFKRLYPQWLYPGKTDRDPSQIQDRVPANYSLDPLNPLTWLTTARWIIDVDPEIAIIEWWTTFLAPAYLVLSSLLKRKGIRILFLIHNVLPHEPKPWDSGLARLTLRSGDLFLVHAKSQNDQLLALIPGTKIFLCPLPVYHSFVQQRISSGEAKNQLGISPDRPVLLFFGIVRPYKGLKFAVEALARLRDKGIVAHLIIAGEFWEKDTPYRKLIESLDLKNQVTIEDRYIRNEEIGLYFSAADVYLAPYVSGTQSAAAKLALGFDLPVVATTVIEDELLIDYPKARIVPPGEIDALADAVIDLLSQPALRNESSSEKVTGWVELALDIVKMVEN